MEGQQTLLRIFIGESDRHGGTTLYQAIVEKLRAEHISGCTVLRGIEGFGAKSVLHTASILRLSQDLPIVIEAVDTPENIERILPVVEEMVGDGLITLETVRVIRYGVKEPPG